MKLLCQEDFLLLSPGKETSSNTLTVLWNEGCFSTLQKVNLASAM